MIFSSKRRKPASPCYPRMQFGISQQQLADILGVSRSLVTMMEQGKRKLPRDVNNIYLRLCRKADELPSPAAMAIKRGRKPTGSNSDLFFVPLVSNYRRGNFDTRISWKRSRHLTDLKNKPMPSLEAMAGEAKKEPGCTAFTDKLKEQKNRLSNFYKFLEFKKELRPLRHIEVSARLEGINKMLDFMKPLEEGLPDGRGKRRIKFLIAFNSYKQMKLSKELKKWDVPALLKTELQMNCIQSQVSLTDEWIAALNNTMQQPGDIQYCLSSEIAA
jgi:transcriptional regulator with XRE-family HTH domain